MVNKDIKNTISCGSRKIKINKITLKGDDECDISTAKDTITKKCEDQHTCTITNNDVGCPGYEFGIEYACVESESSENDSSDTNIMSQTMAVNIGDIVSSGGSHYDESVTRLIQESVANRLQNMNYQLDVNTVDDEEQKVTDNQDKENFNQLAVLSDINQNYSRYNIWIYVSLFLILIIIIICFTKNFITQ